ncbi:hypothetical protein TIFTF001_030715 [Ficus carica]|uniref:Uncharacterized protein n=1 Tax=Ficus carica TaxID=3494 RepID=A0AA88J4I8_FICCA|nr:hypothetical protein TIFTF001_030715 [Ficus carica]
MTVLITVVQPNDYTTVLLNRRVIPGITLQFSKEPSLISSGLHDGPSGPSCNPPLRRLHDSLEGPSCNPPCNPSTREGYTTVPRDRHVISSRGDYTTVPRDRRVILLENIQVVSCLPALPTARTHIYELSLTRATLDNEETKLYYPVRGRFSRLQPQLPYGYFGNVNFRAVSIAVVVDNDYLRSSVDYLEQLPEISAAAYGPQMHMSPNFIITSWVRFPSYDTDFGWGRPLYMGPGDLRLEGKAYIFRNAQNDGSVRITIALQFSHMEVFEELFFNDYKVSTAYGVPFFVLKTF